ncbi:hypothetical protein [Microlunatus parietis]|uniref:Uncharacterized protein n=1 Tax=Microlunatus parietis TaxID=682979 RepID=A0A7Y9I9S9_9ACTN|nr:hypothetical protein [Microlunatus parietis]NYE72653.1 hypothetical protein [Microlunatus parietis]
MDRRRQRMALRTLHLVLAVALGCYVYLPPAWTGGLRTALMIIGVPLTVITGLALWQHARVRRWLRSRRTVADRGR